MAIQNPIAMMELAFASLAHREAEHGFRLHEKDGRIIFPLYGVGDGVMQKLIVVIIYRGVGYSLDVTELNMFLVDTGVSQGMYRYQGILEKAAEMLAEAVRRVQLHHYDYPRSGWAAGAGHLYDVPDYCAWPPTFWTEPPGQIERAWLWLERVCAKLSASWVLLAAMFYVILIVWCLMHPHRSASRCHGEPTWEPHGCSSTSAAASTSKQ